MSKTESTIDAQEVAKFAEHAPYWWDKNGPLKTLHDINETRLHFMSDACSLDKATVLDVGCGGGILCEALAKAGAQVTGIDAAADAIAVAQKHAQEHNLSINYVSMPIEEYTQEGFDIISCMEMLEHVQNPALVLQHCQRLLKPGGMLFLSTISRTLKAYATAVVGAEYILNIVPKQTHEYDKFIKPSELVSMTRSLGFELVNMSGLKYNPFSRQASLHQDVSVNYLLALRRLAP